MAIVVFRMIYRFSSCSPLPNIRYFLLLSLTFFFVFVVCCKKQELQFVCVFKYFNFSLFHLLFFRSPRRRFAPSVLPRRQTHTYVAFFALQAPLNRRYLTSILDVGCGRFDLLDVFTFYMSLVLLGLMKCVHSGCKIK